MTLKWYVAVAERHAVIERKREEGDAELPPQTVMERLEAKGDQIFYPKARITRQRRDRKANAPVRETLWVPVFGRYLFVGSTRKPGYIRGTRGVMDLLNNADGEPGTLPPPLIEEMRRKYRNYKIAQKISELPLKPGQTVRIMEGAFRGFDAKVHLIDLAKGLLTGVTQAMGREVPITLHIEDVAC